jgi:hypothetical protein
MGVRRPPLEQWVDQISVDPWLQARVRQLALDPFGDWSWLVAAAMITRLLEVPVGESQPSIEQAQKRRDFILDRVEPIHLWGRSLASSEVKEIVDLGRVTVEALDLRLTELSASSEAREQSAAWQADFFRFCRERDDLEGVFSLVRDALESSTLVQAIEALDKRAHLFVETLSEMPTLDDEHLRRVWLQDGELWWGLPAALKG